MSSKDEPPVWDLSPLVESEEPEDVKRALDDTLKLAEDIVSEYKGRLKDLTPAGIDEFYKKCDQAFATMNHIIDYTRLKWSQDSRDSTGRELFEYATKIDTDLNSRLAFVNIEIARMLMNRPDIVNNPAVAEYRHVLEKTKARGKYLLSESDEQLIREKDHYGIDSWSTLHAFLKSIRQYELTYNGETKALTVMELYNILHNSTDRKLRIAATDVLYNGIKVDKIVLATALKCIFGDHLSQVKRRKQPSVLTQSLLSNDIDQDVLDNLISSVKKHTLLIRKYMELRARVMGISKLTGYDISPARAPPLVESQSHFPWSKAKELVLDAYTGFDKEAGKFVKSLFDQRRIDASFRPGKTATGRCSPFPLLRSSWIMMNYGNTLNDMSTLVHELGHALHDYYSSEKHKNVTSLSSTCVAETASIFGEMLLFDKLMQESNDEVTRLTVLERILNALYINVYFQLNRYIFELSVYTAMDNNEAIDERKLDQLWIEARTEVFGDSVDWIPGMEQVWMVPIHFFVPRFRFYNYPYAFGQLLALTLYNHYKKDGSSFVPKMKCILSAGGSESPKALFGEIGLDLTDSEFWEAGFKQAELYLKEFEKLVNKRTQS